MDDECSSSASAVHFANRVDLSLNRDFLLRDNLGAGVQLANELFGTAPRTVVLKRFVGASDLGRLNRELRSLRRVHHPYVGAVLYTFREANTVYAALPHYTGGTIDQWVRLHAGSPETLLRAFTHVAQGLAVVHGANIVHCDVKPANIVMAGPGAAAAPKIIDFDLATSDDPMTAHATLTRTRLGATLAFAAPEVRAALSGGTAAVSPAALARLRTPAVDVYSLGRTLEVCLLADDRDERIAESLAAVEGKLRRIAKSFMAEDPRKRPSAAGAAVALEALWAEVRTAVDTATAANLAVVECSLCGAPRGAGEIATCARPVTGDAGPHSFCRDCLGNNALSWCELSMEAQLKGPGGGRAPFCAVPMPGGEVCGAALTGATGALPAEAEAAVTQRTEALVEHRAVEAYRKEQRERGAFREALEKIAELLVTRCPHCRTASVIDFTACMALICTSCHRQFCAFCDIAPPPGADLHGHVIDAHRDAADSGQQSALFVSKAHYETWKRRSKADEIESVIAALESNRDREELRRRAAQM